MDETLKKIERQIWGMPKLAPESDQSECIPVFTEAHQVDRTPNRRASMQHLGKGVDGYQRTRFQNGVMNVESFCAEVAAHSPVFHLVAIKDDGRRSSPSSSRGP